MEIKLFKYDNSDCKDIGFLQAFAGNYVDSKNNCNIIEVCVSLNSLLFHEVACILLL